MAKKRKAADAPKAGKHGATLAQEMDPEFVEERSFRERERAPKARKRQEADEFIGTGISGRILKEARQQQHEVEREREEETGVAAARQAFEAAAAAQQGAAAARPDLLDSEEEEGGDGDEEGDLFSETESRYDEEHVEEVTEEDERAIAAFLSKDSAPQRTLADAIMARIKEKGEEAGFSLGAEGEERTVPGLDEKVAEVYRGVGKLLSRYRAGKVPKAFKIVPSLARWEEVLFLTAPEAWSPHAVLAATRLFASNLGARAAQRFCHLVLLPRARADIRQNRRLHFALYQALRKAAYKPSAFYKGLLLPLCQARDCTLREAVIFGSVLQKVSIPVLHSSVALMKIAEMEYAGTNSYFMKVLLDKKYALPYRVVDAVAAHFARFAGEERELPVIWHLCLLTFVQRYKDEMSEEDKEALRHVMRKQRHRLVTPEIQRELLHSRARGQKADAAPAPGAAPAAGGAPGGAALLEDYTALPEVAIGMDED